MGRPVGLSLGYGRESKLTAQNEPHTANITVAVATLDRPDRLLRCLRAILSGSTLPAEVLVVDQSRGDETQQALETYQAQEQFPSSVPKIVYVKQAKRGLSASRNAGVARASCPVVAVTDDDCVPDSGWVAALENAFSSSQVDAVSGRMLPLGSDAPGVHATASRTSHARRDFQGKAIPMLIGTGGNFALKREWFERAGGYDERLGAGSPGKAGEDIDFLYRLLRAGACIRYEPDALVYHERQSTERYIASRWNYGYGIGAFCGVWLGKGDAYSLRILAFWLRFQGRAFLSTLVERDWQKAHQKRLSLAGTASGLLYGLRHSRKSVDYD